jgi:hypothetical protein
MAEVVYEAWKRGARFDAWNEGSNYEIWQEAFGEVGLDPGFYTLRPRPLDEIFPWDHISTTVRKNFLSEDYRWSLRGKTRIDCRFRCFACGVLPAYAEIRSHNPGEVWQCPDVPSREARQQARQGRGNVIQPESIEVL